MAKANNTSPVADPKPVLTELHRADDIDAETFTYAIEGDSPLAKLDVINRFHADIQAAEIGNHSTVANAAALQASVLRRKDAAVLAIAELLCTVPEALVKARMHKEYGGTINNQGKESPTTPNDGGLLKAAIAYRGAMTFCNGGTIPASWAHGKGTRAEIAELLDESDKAELALEIESKSKVGVSDVISRFFRELTPKAAPTWRNIEKLEEMATILYANAEYVADNPELVAAYEKLAAAARDCVANAR